MLGFMTVLGLVTLCWGWLLYVGVRNDLLGLVTLCLYEIVVGYFTSVMCGNKEVEFQHLWIMQPQHVK